MRSRATKLFEQFAKLVVDEVLALSRFFDACNKLQNPKLCVPVPDSSE